MLELDSIPSSQRRIILMTELVPGLTVAQFWDRIMEDASRWWPVPNRILWHILRCLVRSVMAMAQPPDRPYGESNEPPTLEPLPQHEPTKEDYQIHHGDMNPTNVLFGDLDRGEHSLVPILRVIDFGVARDSSEFPGATRTITQANIRDMTCSFDLIMDDKDPNLDEELGNLVNQCSNLDSGKRPKLATLFGTIQNAIHLKTGPQYFIGKPRAQWESTNRIRQYVQRMILDADIDQ
ncbi:hypothetical protein F5X99DRAFT_375619 [Biscogniauxia marginata]|nr:hypothetical protein F5X99DRAFT_375619 [Biscogniauxia marginata]